MNFDADTYQHESYVHLRSLLAPELADLPAEDIERIVAEQLPGINAIELEEGLKSFARSIGPALSQVGNVVQRAAPGALQGAISGASLGAAAGPYGMLAGAIGGAALGPAGVCNRAAYRNKRNNGSSQRSRGHRKRRLRRLVRLQPRRQRIPRQRRVSVHRCNPHRKAMPPLRNSSDSSPAPRSGRHCCRKRLVLPAAPQRP